LLNSRDGRWAEVEKAELIEEIIQLQRQVNRALRQDELDIWI
jgi:hypothetical protein